jgi:hypothetical protein
MGLGFTISVASRRQKGCRGELDGAYALPSTAKILLRRWAKTLENGGIAKGNGIPRTPKA